MTKHCLLYAILFIIFWRIVASKAATKERNIFLTLSKTKTYVDKTPLIKAILQTGRRILITAPPKFGKSTNLQMIKLFFSINSPKQNKAKDIFTDLQIYKEDQKLFETHFSKWPVLFVDLSTKAVILNLDDVIEELKMSIHRCYKEHTYLLKSTKLDEYEKRLCKNWMTDYKNMEECDTSLGLPLLAKYLHKHFKKSVIVLVDGYDAIISTAMSRVVDDYFFDRIVTLVSGVLEKVLDNKSIKLELAVVTGVSYFSSGEMLDCLYLDRFPFLNDHPFAGFYGFFLAEVNSIFNRMAIKINETWKETGIQFYNGYNSKGGFSVFNPSSITQFSTNGRLENYLDPSAFIEKTYYLLKFPNIEDCFNDLLSGNAFKATIYKSISKEKVIELKDLYHKMVDEPPDINIYLSHLLELGYLSYVSPEGGTKKMEELKLANQEMKRHLLRAYKKYYTETYDLNTNRVEDLDYLEFKASLMKCREYKEKLNYEKNLRTE